MVYFEDDFVKIEYETSKDFILLFWKQKTTGSAHYRLLLSKVFALIKQSDVKYILVDLSLRETVTSKLVDWMKLYLVPNLSVTSLQKIGFVVGTFFSKGDAKELCTILKDIKIDCKTFTALEAALKWLSIKHFQKIIA